MIYNFNVPNALPRFDGDVTPYFAGSSPLIRSASRFNSVFTPFSLGRLPTDFPMTFASDPAPLLYVNGLQNVKDAHRLSCLCLSKITRRVVFGVFNMPGSYFTLGGGVNFNPLWDEIIAALQDMSMPSGSIQSRARAILIPFMRGAQAAGTFGDDLVQGFSDILSPIFCGGPIALFSLFVDMIRAAAAAFLLGGQIASNLIINAWNTANNAFGGVDLANIDLRLPILSVEQIFQALKEIVVTIVLGLDLGAVNLATASLFNFLCEIQKTCGRVRVVAHSQGTLISSNAVDAWMWASNTPSSAPPIRPIIPCKFYVLAGAAWNYPGGINLAFYSFNEDYVPLLSLGASFDKNAFGVLNAFKSQKSKSFNNADSGMTFSGVAAHGIDGYFLGKFVDDIRADLGLPGLNNEQKNSLRLEFVDDMKAMGINV